jgi:hypothetical protein
MIVQNREPADGNGENVRQFVEPMFDPGLTVLMFVDEQERASDAAGNGTSLGLKSKPIWICGPPAGVSQKYYRHLDYSRLAKNLAIPATWIKPTTNMLSYIRGTRLTQVI